MRYNKLFLSNVAIELNEIHCALPPIHLGETDSELFTEIIQVANTVPPQTYHLFSNDVCVFLKKESTYKNKNDHELSNVYTPVVRSVAPIPFF